jgi:hypothetical protein
VKGAEKDNALKFLKMKINVHRNAQVGNRMRSAVHYHFEMSRVVRMTGELT